MLFIYCFDEETRWRLSQHGLVQLNPDSPVPFIFSNNPLVDLENIEGIKNRYVLTNEMVYDH